MDYYQTFSDQNGNSINPVEHMRKRPGMYVGGTDVRALHHLVYEVLDHMVEEAYVGRCSHVWIELHNNNWITIRDNSPGLPVERFQDTEFTWMEVLLQDLSYRKSDFYETPYSILGGLHGLGLTVVNALSAHFDVKNYRAGHVYKKSYEAGVATSYLRKSPAPDHQTGTVFRFQPDYSVFDAVDFDFKRIGNRAQQVAYQTAGLTVEVSDHRQAPPVRETFYYADGLKSYVSDFNKDIPVYHETLHVKEIVVIPRPEHTDYRIEIEIAFQFADRHTPILEGYANTVLTPDGGTHLSAMEKAILKALNARLTDTKPLVWEEVAHHLVAVVSIRHPDPQFQSPTKMELLNPEITSPVMILIETLFAQLSPDDLRRVLNAYLSNRTS